MKSFKRKNPLFDHEQQRGLLSISRPLCLILLVVVSGVLFLDFSWPCKVMSDVVPNDEIKAVCNQVMKEIYEEVLSNQYSSTEFRNFGPSSLEENQFGFLSLHYIYDEEFSDNESKNSPFEISAMITPLENKTDVTSNAQVFKFEYPILGVRLSGYQKNGFNHINLNGIVKKISARLEDEQQDRMPLKLTLKTTKKEYHRKEDIEFLVSLSNHTKHNIMVKHLSDKTLSFQINNQFDDSSWDSKGYKSEKSIILSPGGSISKKFTLTDIPASSVINIQCVYVKTYEGINPKASLKIDLIR